MNDELGHAMGDLLLKEAADVIRETIRVSDLAGRLGGDEFCVLLMGDPELRSRSARVDRLRADRPRTTTLRPGRDFPLSLSIGLSATPGRALRDARGADRRRGRGDVRGQAPEARPRARLFRLTRGRVVRDTHSIWTRRVKKSFGHSR